MMSVGFSAPPITFFNASSIRLRSYVKSIAIDEVPDETMPNISPWWMSVPLIFLSRSRTRAVFLKSRCRSSMNSRKIRPDASLWAAPAAG